MTPAEVFDKLDHKTLDRLNRYVTLLGKWRKVTNLISEEGFADIWARHILDSIYLQRQAPVAKSWLDFGSGAGLPAAIIAIMLADVPDARVHCIEIDRRKCSFLREVAAQLSIPLKIHNILADDVNPSNIGHAEIVTARAFSSIERIMKLAQPFLSTGAVVLIPRGRQFSDEVARLDAGRYTVATTSNPAGDGVLLRIELRA